MDAPSIRSHSPGYGHYALVALLCFTLALLLFGQTFAHDFVYFDDDGYVLDNAMVRAGLTFEGVTWAFQTFYMANWHPLTWLSYMVDASLFGVEPGWYLLHNALLHAANSVLVYAVLLRLGQHRLSALLGALVFLVHPLHVESVAWIAERKDVLSGLFYLSGLLFYLQWMEKGSRGLYFCVLSCCALALMAKPMAVTFPLVLILFDLLLSRGNIFRAALEKWPLLLMCFGAGVATLLAQGDSGAVSGMDIHAIELRLANTVMGYTTYLHQFAVPTELAAFYPLNDHPGWRALVLSCAVFVLLLCTVVVCWRRHRLVSMGISFYLVTLLPVIGIMQVGLQAHADRYMYIPSIGLLIAGLDIPRVLKAGRLRLVTGCIIAWSGLLLMLCFWQIAYWENRGILFNRVLLVNGPVYLAHVQMAEHHTEHKDYELAMSHAQQALALEPERVAAQIAMGDIAMGMGDLASAELFYMAAVSKSQEGPHLLNKIGVLWAEQGKMDAALGLFRRALEISPIYYPAMASLQKYGGNS